MNQRADLLQGTLDLLILKSLVLGPLHGWAISKRLRQLSDDVLDVGQGSLYPALPRIREVSGNIATAVAEVAHRHNLGTGAVPSDIRAHVRAQMYDPHYQSYL